MNSDERLDRLEHRLAVLERLVRQLLPLLSGARPPLVEIESAEPVAAAALDTVTPPGAPPTPRPRPVPPRKPIARPVAERPVIDRPSPRVSGADPAPVDREQWFGQRGLLGVGVTFIILAAGYLLKLSFDRGWISPLARCVGGAMAGVAVGGLGWRLNAKGLRTYGAALIGTGAAIIYLVVWAASRLYQFFPPTTATVALALISLSLAAIAMAIDVEALGATAALGAFFAPLVLGIAPANGETLLLYLGSMGVALGWVAARRRWRMAMLVIAVSYFAFATNVAFEHANVTGLLVYALIGGCSGLYIGLREGWWETRIISFGGGWGLLGLANEHTSNHWSIVFGAIILAAPVWWRALRTSLVLPSTSNNRLDNPLSVGETFYFYLTPILLGWAVDQLRYPAFDEHAGLVALIVAVPYLLTGFSALRKPFAMVGTTAVLIATLLQWSGIEAAWVLLGLSVLWAALDHVLHRDDGRWYGLVALIAGMAHLLYVDFLLRGTGDAAFVGAWALTLWTTGIVFAAYGGGLWQRAEHDVGRNHQALFWTAAGLILLFGVTGEINRYFEIGVLPPTTADLASGLTVSAWWIVFAAGLVILGFRRDLKPVRVAGLLVSGMAILKVVLFDLSTLDALYRIGSVLCLGVVSLGLAYIYNKRAGGEAQ